MSRETRLLAGVVIVSAAALVLLARFRFPAEDRPVNPSPAPLERLAARATFDDLASIVAQLQTRLTPSLAVLRVVGIEAGEGTAPLRGPLAIGGDLPRSRLVLAVRIGDDFAVAHVAPGDRVEAVVGDVEAESAVVGVDPVRMIGLVRLKTTVAARPVSGSPERTTPAPRYVAVAEATEGGPVLRPIFLGRTDPIRDPRWNQPLLALGGTAVTPPGAFIFSLDGRFEGLTAIEEDLPVLVTTEALLSAVRDIEQGRVGGGGDLGIDVSDLTSPLISATGAAHGAVVTYVKPTGPSASALQVGDVIETFDDAPVYSADRLHVEITRTRPGARVTLGIVRAHQPLQVSLSPAPAIATTPAASLGLVLRETPGAGAEVLRVSADSAAGLAGFEPADLITTLDDRAMPAPAEVQKAFSAAAPGTYLLAGVARGQQHLVLAIRKP